MRGRSRIPSTIIPCSLSRCSDNLLRTRTEIVPPRAAFLDLDMCHFAWKTPFFPRPSRSPVESEGHDETAHFGLRNNYWLAIVPAMDEKVPLAFAPTR